jgi:hypothetical protein
MFFAEILNTVVIKMECPRLSQENFICPKSFKTLLIGVEGT